MAAVPVLGSARPTMPSDLDPADDAAHPASLLANGEASGQLITAHVSQLQSLTSPTPFCSTALSTAASSLAQPGPLPGLEATRQLSSPLALASIPGITVSQAWTVGLAALDIFLQANVTGPVPSLALLTSIEKRFDEAWTDSSPGNGHDGRYAAPSHQLRSSCLAHLDVDGVSPYPYTPHLELFSLARYIFIHLLDSQSGPLAGLVPPSLDRLGARNLAWMQLRIKVWHYRLLTQPSPGSGSAFFGSSPWLDVPTLTLDILDSIHAQLGQLEGTHVVPPAGNWSDEERTHFLVETASNYVLLGRHDHARETLNAASRSSGFAYALTGALGKRTRFQEKSTSQLLVLARSRSLDNDCRDAPTADALDREGSLGDQHNPKPDSLLLNDDTLLENIDFSHNSHETRPQTNALPPSLADLSPDDQPQLAPLDQIILLTEATLRDTSSAFDVLTLEEVLPFAVRVLADKETNWQIYTQALLVRSRIEMHRSRTLERGIFQLQAVVDQVIADTTAQDGQPLQQEENAVAEAPQVPAIRVQDTDQNPSSAQGQVTKSFLPAPRASESAPADVRLRYIYALSSPPRWHLESELAHAWAGVGSLVSALEVFKRLRLWAEVALCLAGAAAAGDEDGRGGGGEDRAKAVIRWRLMHRTGLQDSKFTDADDEPFEEVMRLRTSDFEGPERKPPPPNAARLWCILGDLENDPGHYRRAWEVSKHRYARAQKSLGEHYLQQQDWHSAEAAYKLATAVNRLDPSLWTRLGDIRLRLGQFAKAAEAFGRSIASATDAMGGEDARTWSNLGSSLWSLYRETIETRTADATQKDSAATDEKGADEEEVGDSVDEARRDPGILLAQSLAAYKKGASISHDNWRIWDNVLTLASRMQPPAVSDMVLAFKQLLRIRKDEKAIDLDVLAVLVQQGVLVKDNGSLDGGLYEPPRGSTERLVTRLVEDDMVPLITQRSDLWALVARLRSWRRDYEGAIEAAERAWRAAVGSTSSGGLAAGDVASRPTDWTTEEPAWAELVERTNELVSALENWGPRVEALASRWQNKARSALRTVMGRGRESWEGTEGWKRLEALKETLKRE